jgi:hypothetical protein
MRQVELSCKQLNICTEAIVQQGYMAIWLTLQLTVLQDKRNMEGYEAQSLCET